MTTMHTDLPVFIPALDYDRLTAIAEGVARQEPDVANFLLRKLDNASTTAPARKEPVVTMGSHVRFRDETTGQVRDAQLVYPENADVAQQRISILTPVGAALIGLSEGQTMQWNNRSGAAKSLTVLKVQNEMEIVA